MIKKFIPSFVREYLHWFRLRKMYPGTEFSQSVIVNSGCKFGDHVVIQSGVEVISCSIGCFSYVGSQSKLINAQIGNFCSIAPQVIIGGYKHPSNPWVSTSPIFYSTKKQSGINFVMDNKFNEELPTFVGNDVWIGYKAIVLPGIRIGDGVIIGAGAVVTKDIPSYAIVTGIPAKTIRKRFDDSTIERLLNFRWWEKSEEWLRTHADSFRDINQFITLINKDKKNNLDKND